MIRPHQLPLHLPVRPNYSATDFVRSPCNWEAIQWIERWPDWPVKMVAVSGEPGCGKTHLAHIWQAKTQARFLIPEDWNHLSPLDVTKNHQAFVLDDADTFPSESWFFHFYNLIQEKGAYLLLGCLVPPARWSVKLPDLHSRLSTILSVAVHPPDEEALRAVLFKLFTERGMTITAEVADYILRRIERSFNSVRTVVDLIDHYTLSTHRQPTLGLVRDVLSDTENS
jgi:DnaA regulatory inactivator Hda